MQKSEFERTRELLLRNLVRVGISATQAIQLINIVTEPEPEVIEVSPTEFIVKGF